MTQIGWSLPLCGSVTSWWKSPTPPSEEEVRKGILGEEVLRRKQNWATGQGAGGQQLGGIGVRAGLAGGTTLGGGVGKYFPGWGWGAAREGQQAIYRLLDCFNSLSLNMQNRAWSPLHSKKWRILLLQSLKQEETNSPSRSLGW